MIQLLYFARLRETLNQDAEQYPLTAPVTVAELMQLLAARGGDWATEFSGCTPIRAAVNQELVANDALIQPGDEVAFFPPVTGG